MFATTVDACGVVRCLSSIEISGANALDKIVESSQRFFDALKHKMSAK